MRTRGSVFAELRTTDAQLRAATAAAAAGSAHVRMCRSCRLCPQRAPARPPPALVVYNSLVWKITPPSATMRSRRRVKSSGRPAAPKRSRVAACRPERCRRCESKYGMTSTVLPLPCGTSRCMMALWNASRRRAAWARHRAAAVCSASASARSADARPLSCSSAARCRHRTLRCCLSRWSRSRATSVSSQRWDVCVAAADHPHGRPYTRAHTHTNTHTRTRARRRAHPQTHTHTYTHALTDPLTLTRTHIRAHTHPQARTHTHNTHQHTQKKSAQTWARTRLLTLLTCARGHRQRDTHTHTPPLRARPHGPRTPAACRPRWSRRQ